LVDGYVPEDESDEEPTEAHAVVDEENVEPGDLDSDDEDDNSVEAVEEKFRQLEEEVAILVADVHDLALYTKLNFTGFMKIVKVTDNLYILAEGAEIYFSSAHCRNMM